MSMQIYVADCLLSPMNVHGRWDSSCKHAFDERSFIAKQHPLIVAIALHYKLTIPKYELWTT